MFDSYANHRTSHKTRKIKKLDDTINCTHRTGFKYFCTTSTTKKSQNPSKHWSQVLRESTNMKTLQKKNPLRKYCFLENSLIFLEFIQSIETKMCSVWRKVTTWWNSPSTSIEKLYRCYFIFITSKMIMFYDCVQMLDMFCVWVYPSLSPLEITNHFVRIGS